MKSCPYKQAGRPAEPALPACFHNGGSPIYEKGESVSYCAFGTILISTRLFIWRPASVSLVATGMVSPEPDRFHAAFGYALLGESSDGVGTPGRKILVVFLNRHCPYGLPP